MNDRFLRLEEVKKVTGLSKSTIWRLERLGHFPRRYRLSPNSVGWRFKDLTEWLESRPECPRTNHDAAMIATTGQEQMK